MHRYHTLKYLKNSKKTVEKFKLTDQRRNKAFPCSYVDQYAKLFSAEGTSASSRKSIPIYACYFSPAFR